MIFLMVFLLANFSTKADDFFILKTHTDLWGVVSSYLNYFSPFDPDKQVFLAENCALAEFFVAQVFG